jgi:uncharacterized protein with NRDE domain
LRDATSKRVARGWGSRARPFRRRHQLPRPSDKRPTARSRGTLVTEFLSTDTSALAFARALAPHVRDYNGFNLILGDGASLVYFGSREGEAREIAPGIHGLSNHLLDEPWPKVVHGREAMAEALRDGTPRPALFEMLSATAGAPDESLPRTGVGIEWERRLASALIRRRRLRDACPPPSSRWPKAVTSGSRKGLVRATARSRACRGIA